MRADVALLKNAIRTLATDERARKLRGHIAQDLHTNFLTPAAASKLRGRLGPPHLVTNGEVMTWNDGSVGPATVRLKILLANP